MKQKIIEKTYDVVEEIKSTNEYQRLLELHREIAGDKEVQELISIFQKYNKKYEEVSKYGKYHPDIKKVQQEFSVAKENLYSNEVIKEYKKLENQIQKTLNHISKELATNISSKIKHPNELGLINKH